LLIAALALGCGSATEVPEAGAILLRVSVGAGMPMPDELRVSVYDDTGALWRDARFPEDGAPPAARGGRSLGTILIQPGATTGALRIHVRGRMAGARVLDGVLHIAPGDRARGTFDVELQADVPDDVDGDDVPDAIDDCPSASNPAQGGCPGVEPDAGGPTDAGNDAAGGMSGGAGRGGGGTTGGGGGQSGTNGGGAGTSAVAGSGGAGGAAAAGRGGASGGAGGVGTAGAGGGGRGGAGGGAGIGGRGGGAGNIGAAGSSGGAGRGGAGSGGADAGVDTGSSCPFDGGCNLDRGVACSNAGQCRTGFCADGVCCDTACNGVCQTCGTGTCQGVRNAEDAPECAAPMRCNGAGRCTSS
jgi:hypothetical protein